MSRYRNLLRATSLVSMMLMSNVTAAHSDARTSEGQQRSNHNKQRPYHRGPEQMIKQLHVSEAQRTKLLAIIKEQHQKRMEIHQQYRGSRQSEHHAMESLHLQTVERIRAVLDEEQLGQFKKLMDSERPPRPPHQRPQFSGGKPPQQSNH